MCQTGGWGTPIALSCDTPALPTVSGNRNDSISGEGGKALLQRRENAQKNRKPSQPQGDSVMTVTEKILLNWNIPFWKVTH